jgi:hypothetical protein
VTKSSSFGGDALGIGLGAGNDLLGLALGAGAAGLVLLEQLGRLIPQPPGVVELGLDAIAAVIERRQHGAVDAEIGEHAHQDDEGDRNPGFRIFEHQISPLTTRPPRH